MPLSRILNPLRRRAVMAGLVLVGVAVPAGYEVHCQLEKRAMADQIARSDAPDVDACLLPEEELKHRIALYKQEVVPLVSNVERGDELLRLTMTSSPEDTKALAEKMAKLEEDCCAFLTITYAPEDDTQIIRVGAADVFLDQLMRALGLASPQQT